MNAQRDAQIRRMEAGSEVDQRAAQLMSAHPTLSASRALTQAHQQIARERASRD